MKSAIYRETLASLLVAAGLSLSAVGCADDGENVEYQPSPQECEDALDLDGLCTDELESDERMQQICVPAGPDGECEVCDADEIIDAAADQSFGFCDSTGFERIACGPKQNVSDQCCYDYVYRSDPTLCESTETTAGRPFFVDGQMRRARLGRGGDWSPTVAPRLDGLSEVQRETLAAEWTSDGLAEHASIAAFARHILELMALGAPAELVAAAQRALADEIEHARLCFGLASAYAGFQVAPGEMAMDGALSNIDRNAVAVGLIREGCIGETLAAVIAGVSRDACDDELVVEVLDVINEDEGRHAALAWKTLRWMLDNGDAEFARLVRGTFENALVTVGAETGPADDRLRSLGRPSAWEKSSVAAEAARKVIRPAMESLLRETTRPRLVV
jgi:hypothetical protein